MADDDQVQVRNVAARPLASVRTTTTHERLGTDIRRLLDQVWPVLRAQDVRTGHNVVVYYTGSDGTLTIEAGVETLTEFTGSGEVQPSSTPSGAVATAAHYGEYSGLHATYAALDQWCKDHDHRPVGVNWEVYGDWTEDPADLRTDVYFLLSSDDVTPSAPAPG
jgi:effector-binding domain-containing protein